MEVSHTELRPLRQRVEAKFLRFMESFAVTEYREVRAILRDVHRELSASPPSRSLV